MPKGTLRGTFFTYKSAHLRLLLRELSTSSAHSSQVLPNATGNTSKRRWSGILLFIPGLSAFGLGCWQLKRRDWKVELLEYQRSRLHGEVLPLDVALGSVFDDSREVKNMKRVDYNLLQSLEYRRVRCEGTYDEDKSIYLGPRGRTNHGVTERGYYLITPLIPPENSMILQVPVLVNRGWVPGNWRDNPPEQKQDGHKTDASVKTAKVEDKIFLSALFGRKQQTAEVEKHETQTVKVEGVIRGSENPNMFVPPNEPSSGQWFFVDVPAMAASVNLPEHTIYVEALREKAETFQLKQYPVPKDPDALISSSVMPRDHLSYAITWFTLSAATTFMAWKRLSKK